MEEFFDCREFDLTPEQERIWELEEIVLSNIFSIGNLTAEVELLKRKLEEAKTQCLRDQLEIEELKQKLRAAQDNLVECANEIRILQAEVRVWHRTFSKRPWSQGSNQQ